MSRGTLYIVATPIGNLKDITLRALETLREVDFIAAEDTRHTQKLLNRYEIKKKLLSFHEYSGEARLEAILGALEEGEDGALVSDAGTPVISDPGYILVKSCAERGIDVVSVPGACAAVAAVTLCGLDCSNFVFAGFLPAKSAARKKELARLKAMRVPLVLYESPRRAVKTLEDVCEVMGGETRVCAAREMTKAFEETVRDTAEGALRVFSERENVQGEFVFVVDAARAPEADDAAIDSALLECMRKGMTKKEAAAAVAAALSCPKNKAYRRLIDLTGQ